MEKQSGIYCITNKVNGHKYIGSAVNFQKRWGQHKRDLYKNEHHSRYLQNAWNLYGEDCFEFSVIEYCEKEHLLEREQIYINSEHPAYNIAQTAGSVIGLKHSDETKRKLSQMNSGEKHFNFGKHLSEETRDRIGKANKGRCRTEEWRRKIGEANSGKIPSEETRRKLSEANLGRKMSEESKQKMSESISGERNCKYGKHLPEEWRRKIGEANKGEKNWNFGNKLTEEQKQKISDSLQGTQNALGHKCSDEAKRKMSEARKRYWAEKKATMAEARQ